MALSLVCLVNEKNIFFSIILKMTTSNFKHLNKCSTLGSSFCYFLSVLVARKLVMKYLNNRIQDWQKKVTSKKSDLLYYMIFLRVTPIVPNWFINLASPLIDIPLFQFAAGTFIGKYIFAKKKY